MSDLILSNMSLIPAHIRDAGQSELTKNLLDKMGGVSVKRISIRGKMFRLVVGGEEVAKRADLLDVVVVNIAKDVSRTYYAGVYDPKAEATAPTCWSSDSKVPHPAVPSPQHSNCADCPMNISGSGQGTTRACRFKRRIAVVLAEDLDAGVHMLELPATSLFGRGKDDRTMPFEQYFKYVASQNHSIDRLVTRLRFDDDADTPKLYFSAISFPTVEMMPKLAEYGQSAEAKAAVILTVYQVDKKESAEPVVRAASRKDVPTPKVDVSDALRKFAQKGAEVDDE